MTAPRTAGGTRVAADICLQERHRFALRLDEVRVDRKEHWESVYQSTQPTAVSWYQARAELSARIIPQVVRDHAAPIIDVGGGASVLTSQLYAAGYTDLTVLDLSGSAITAAKSTLGANASRVHWIEADILTADLPPACYQFWHDRAVFHFLTDAAERSVYGQQVRHAVRPGGHVLIATFAEDGPTRCSGLDVVRYSASALAAELGPGLAFVASRREEHQTPSGAAQAFTYCIFRREPEASS
jgi:SAM-dependent methyltransferase